MLSPLKNKKTQGALACDKKPALNRWASHDLF